MAKKPESTVTELGDTDPTQINTAEDAAEAKAVVPEGFLKVILQRPEGERDDYRFVGINAFERRVPYGKPVELPKFVVDNLEEATETTFEPSGNGMKPVVSKKFHIIRL